MFALFTNLSSNRSSSVVWIGKILSLFRIRPPLFSAIQIYKLHANAQPRALGYLPTPHPLAIIHKRLHPLFPRLVELVIILAFVTAISKMLMLIRNIINAECARLIILLYIVLNVVHQFPGNDSYLATPLTLRPLWPRTDTDTNLSTLQLSYDIYM